MEFKIHLQSAVGNRITSYSMITIYVPYSGKFSPKPGPMYCRKNLPDLFSRSLDHQWTSIGLGEINFQRNLYLTLRSLHRGSDVPSRP